MSAAHPEKLSLSLLPDLLSICQLPAGEAVPEWAAAGNLQVVVRTPKELSIVCSQAAVPEAVRSEPGWRALQVEGQLDFSLVGILAAIISPLAEAGISIFAVSTFDTDYVLLKAVSLVQAVESLQKAGFLVRLEEINS